MDIENNMLTIHIEITLNVPFQENTVGKRNGIAQTQKKNERILNNIT